MLTPPQSSLSKTQFSSILDFLRSVWGRHCSGHVFLAAKKGDRWIEQSFDLHKCARWSDWLRDHPAERWDLYYCPNAFAAPKRQATYAYPVFYAWCDIDDGDPNAFDPKPSILWETSPGRTQAIWNFSSAREPAYAEAVSKHLAYSFGGDRNGWSVTKMLRLPGTINHKPAYDRPAVTVISLSEKTIPEWPQVQPQLPLKARTFTVPPDGDVEGVVRRFQAQIEPKYVSLMRHRRLLSVDRSRCIFMIVASLHRAGASLAEIAVVLRRSPYFIDKYGEHEGALTKEITRITSKLDREAGGGGRKFVRQPR